MTEYFFYSLFRHRDSILRLSVYWPATPGKQFNIICPSVNKTTRCQSEAR